MGPHEVLETNRLGLPFFGDENFGSRGRKSYGIKTIKLLTSDPRSHLSGYLLEYDDIILPYVKVCHDAMPLCIWQIISAYSSCEIHQWDMIVER